MDPATQSAEEEKLPVLPSLAAIVFKLLNDDENITDVHCASEEVLRARRASNDWYVPAGADGKPMEISHEQILALINGIYEDEEQPYLYKMDERGNALKGPDKKAIKRTPLWLDELFTKKSLHPSMNLVETVPDEQGQKRHMVQRVRFSIQRQGIGNALGVMARGLREVPTSISALGLPPQVNTMVDLATSGLVIVTGPTGSGKSTTIAAILSKFNETRDSNVVTLEDPVEFQYVPKRCFFTQREIGVDVDSFEIGVIDAMRFALDILVIGEIRTPETMRAALRAAESGHLVLASTHAPNCVAALRKMLAYLDNESDAVALSNCLVGVISQALLPDLKSSKIAEIKSKSKANQKHLAFELLFSNNNDVQAAIANGSGPALKTLEDKLGEGKLEHSMPFIQSLNKLIKDGRVDPRRAAAIVQSAADRHMLLHMASPAPGPAAVVPPPAPGWKERTFAGVNRRA
jgi:Tfp pilus assembly pilus retraction ATPase PilT